LLSLPGLTGQSNISKPVIQIGAYLIPAFAGITGQKFVDARHFGRA
jgi:hypothetical protein